MSWDGKEAVRTTQDLQYVRNVLDATQELVSLFPDARVKIENISATEYAKS